MKTIKVIFTGSLDQVYENFILGAVYSAREIKEDRLLVLDDKACLVEMSSTDFDFEASEMLAVA